MKVTKLLAFVMALAMVASLLPAAGAAKPFEKTNKWENGDFSDVASSEWYASNVKDAYELGLMKGAGNKKFNPSGNISLAETITIAARIHSLATTGEENFVQGNPWYQVYADYALANGIISSVPANITSNATRLQFAEILAKAMSDEDLSAINTVDDGIIPDVASNASVYKLYRAGVLTGGDDKGTFSPANSISRAEVSAIVARMALPETRIKRDLKKTVVSNTEDKKTPNVGSIAGGGSSSGSKPQQPPKNEISATVEVGEDGKVKNEVSMSGEKVNATVPAGVAVNEGADKLTLKVEAMEETGGNIEMGEDETLSSYDVHIDGVSAENTVAIKVFLGDILPAGMNLGNITLYHIENEETNAMTQVMTLDELDEHNEFYYDPATGNVTVALASFSEIAIVAAESKWEGKRDYTWYDASATELTIANADQLAGLSAIVGGMDDRAIDSFKGKTVKMVCDINIGDLDSENGIVFYPVGYYNDDGTYERTNKAITSSFRKFEGTFDGNGHTISNFYQNTWEMKGDHNWYDATLQYYRDGMGIFGKVYGGTVKNLTVDNFSSDGEITTTGTIAAYADCGATFENIAIFNCNPRVYNIGNGGIVGCVGWYANENHTTPVTFRNITVDNTNKISALWGSYDVACGGLVGQYYPTSGQSNAIDNPGIRMENCHVAAQMDVYNDVCANYQYYAYRYAGILIGSVRENVTVDGHVYPDMTGITASGCTVHFGDWNDYYYCELVANSLASYTHDHQMSRLEQVLSVDVENKKITPLVGEAYDIPTDGRYNYVVVKAKDNSGKWIHGDGHDFAECYHFVNGVQHEHDVADSDNPNVYETVDGVEVLKEDKQLIYREFNNLVTGYGWGVTSKGVSEMEEDQVKILDREDAGSVSKFEGIANKEYVSGTSATVGELFKALENAGVEIKKDQVQVNVSPKPYTNSTAGGTYTANASDWTQGTIKFSGEGEAVVSISDYYFCKTTTVTVKILPVEVTMIAVANYKNTFSKGDSFTTGDDFIAIAAYTDGNTKDVTGEVEIDGFDSAEPGVTIITVSYTFKGRTVSTTYEARTIAPVRISAVATKNMFNVGDTLTKNDFKVTAYSSDGTSTTVTDFTIGNVDMSTGGQKTVTIKDTKNNLSATCTIEVINLTLLEIDYTTMNKEYTEWTEDYHRMWWFGTGNYDVSGWKPYPEFGATIPENKTDIGANGETITGFENNWAAIQNSHKDYENSGVGHSNDFKNNNNWYGLTIDNAVPWTTLGINCVVGYDAYMVGFGYYINGDVSTLKYNAPANRYGEGSGFEGNYGKYAVHALTQFTCYDFEPGETYTVTWVAVFEDGIQKISDWTVNMKAASDEDAVYTETEKPNVNVIIMAGQSNMFGASPLTQDIKDNYDDVDFSNVFIKYSNINFDTDMVSLKTYFSNDSFDMYTVGIGGQGNTYFGPELALANTLATTPALNGEQWYIIKYAAAGTGLTAQWTNNCTVDGKSTTLTNDMLDYVQSAIDELSKTYDVKVRSFMWMQGETDACWEANANVYAAAEKNLVNRVRETFGAYATRAASALNVVGSGISFINGGIAINDTDFTTAQGGPNDWVYAELVNAGKISNSQWLCSVPGYNAFGNGTVLTTGPLAGITFDQPTVVNPDLSNAIVNSIYIDTHHLLSKANSTDEHGQYVAESDKVDWAHYGAGAMAMLGEFFGSCLHFLINQNG